MLSITLLGLAAVSNAQTLKMITLKDGSVLKGTVIQMEDGVYTLETPDLGRVDIPESNVLAITSPEASGPRHQPTDPNNEQENADLKRQVQQVQGAILSDPGLMTDIQDVVNDEDVKAMLSDPGLMEDVMSFDQDKIRQSDNVQNLMQNPKMRELMDKIRQKLPANQK